VAHKWDEFSRPLKTFFAFLPLVIGQIGGGYALLKKKKSLAWREIAAAFIFFALGATISLISQIYNIPGNLSEFLLTWMLLAFLLIYVMPSGTAALLYLGGITYYGMEAGYWQFPKTEPYLFWVLLLIALPYYWHLLKNRPRSNFTLFHNWVIPLSVIICLGTLAKDSIQLMFIAYFSLFGLFFGIGNTTYFKTKKWYNNGFRISAVLGMIILLLILSFDSFWKDLLKEGLQFTWTSPELITCIILSLAAAGLLYWNVLRKEWGAIEFPEIIFLLFIATFLIGLSSVTMAVIMINLIVFLLGLDTIRMGSKKNHLGLLNFGLMIITALIICRFFDTDLSFVLRGIIFVCVGLSFFFANYWMLNKKKAEAGIIE